jgi:hypothetical protein
MKWSPSLQQSKIFHHHTNGDVKHFVANCVAKKNFDQCTSLDLSCPIDGGLTSNINLVTIFDLVMEFGPTW